MFITFAQVKNINDLVEKGLKPLTTQLRGLKTSKNELQKKLADADKFDNTEGLEKSIKELDEEINKLMDQKKEIQGDIVKALLSKEYKIKPNSKYNLDKMSWNKTPIGKGKKVSEMTDEEFEEALGYNEELNYLDMIKRSNKKAAKAIEEFEKIANAKNTYKGIKGDFYGVALDKSNYADINGDAIGKDLSKSAIFDSVDEAKNFIDTNDLDHAKVFKYTTDQLNELKSRNHIGNSESIGLVDGEDWDKFENIYVILVGKGKFLSRSYDETSNPKDIWAFTDKDYADSVIEEADEKGNWKTVKASDQFKKKLSWKDVDETGSYDGIADKNEVKDAMDSLGFNKKSHYLIGIKYDDKLRYIGFKDKDFNKPMIVVNTHNAAVFDSYEDADSVKRGLNLKNLTYGTTGGRLDQSKLPKDEKGKVKYLAGVTEITANEAKNKLSPQNLITNVQQNLKRDVNDFDWEEAGTDSEEIMSNNRSGNNYYIPSDQQTSSISNSWRGL